MKTIILLVLASSLFFGCSDSTESDSTQLNSEDNTNLPSCEQQIQNVESCFKTKWDSLSCTTLKSGYQTGYELSQKIALNCATEHLVPGDGEKCRQATQNKFPPLLKENMNKNIIEKCGIAI